MKKNIYINVTFKKLVHGGEALGFCENDASQLLGKAVFAFNALPGETARVELTKLKKDFAKGVAVEILKKSPDRIAPISNDYLINSPWQILKFNRENFYKKEILRETFSKLAKIDLPDFKMRTDEKEFGYRNKMEFNFCDDNGKVALAFFERGTHHKVPVKNSILANDAINDAAQQIVDELNARNIEARDLKTLILRSNGRNVLAALFIKTPRPQSSLSEQTTIPSSLRTSSPRLAVEAGHAGEAICFDHLNVKAPLIGLEIYESNWRSPASTPDKLILKTGDTSLTQKILGKTFQHNALSFFQVNIPVYEMALEQIKKHLDNDKVIDMYCGVGSIGIAAHNGAALIGIDGDKENIKFAHDNAAANNIVCAEFHAAPDFKAMDYIEPDATLLLDPPRAGIHPKLLKTILEKLPKKIIYLSCNPATQARDMELLKQHYKLVFFEGYNFFPRTPHIESLAILTR